MSGRERHNLFHYTNEVLGLACKQDNTCLIVSVIKRSDTYRITGCDILSCFSVIYDARKLRIEHPEHLRAVFEIQRKKYLAVTLALKGVSFFNQHIAEQLEIIYLTVTYAVASSCFKRLHSFIVQTHYG